MEENTGNTFHNTSDSPVTQHGKQTCFTSSNNSDSVEIGECENEQDESGSIGRPQSPQNQTQSQVYLYRGFQAVDVYNDSKLLTPAASSWPSRSLAQLHADTQFKIYGNTDGDAAFSQFQPTAVDLHYRDPVQYAEMLHIEGDMEREKLKEELQNCLGSVDTKQQDKKFVFVRYVGHPTFNFWCACHRSDLAMEDVIRSVPELKIWNSNVVAVSTYYRTSGLRTKELKSIIPKMKSFPAHHEIRFAQHLIKLCES